MDEKDIIERMKIILNRPNKLAQVKAYVPMWLYEELLKRKPTDAKGSEGK